MEEKNRDKIHIKEQKNNPMGNFADGVNRSMVGEPGALAQGGCLTIIITIVVVIIVAFLLIRFLN
ncbi:DUF6366 family protein [Alkalibacillus silvisoli]|uniref:Sporulation protein YjcZ n=1 Tax=Alkalibacillus silvisoli TaxID=392823 RepID=A0ABN1A387_9BACI